MSEILRRGGTRDPTAESASAVWTILLARAVV
jgi:hypothetical protein